MGKTEDTNEEVQDNKEEQLVLTGTVELDDESMEKLREKIRGEVVQRIEEDGCYYDEIVKYIKKCSYKTLFNILFETLDDAVDKVDTVSDLVFDSDKMKYEKLKVIRDILKMRG